jgi:allantoin racemase
MKICVINPFSGREHYGRENLEAIASTDTDFDMVDVSDGYPLRNNQWLYFKYCCTGPTIEKAMQAEREGYDAVFISCNLDIGLYECRQMCSIPVTATLESAALIAHMMGRRFSLLSVDSQNGEIQRMLLERYQLSTGLVSIRPFNINANDLFVDHTPPETSAKTVIETANQCIKQDGAEVLIAGCTHAGSILSRIAREEPDRLPAPVIDGMLTGFKLAELMATLHQKSGLGPVSRLGFFQRPPEADLSALRAFYEMPMPVWSGPGAPSEKSTGTPKHRNAPDA